MRSAILPLLLLPLLACPGPAQLGRAKRLQGEARDIRDASRSQPAAAPAPAAAPPARPAQNIQAGSVPTAHKSAGAGQLNELQFLESKGASLTAPDADGNTPLHLAAYKGQTEVVAYLLQRPGMLKDPLDKRGLTPLMLAAYSGHTETVKALLLGGCNLALKAPDGSTALHQAAAQGQLGAVEALLESGADPAALDAKGQNAAQRAAQKRKGEWERIVERLKQS